MTEESVYATPVPARIRHRELTAARRPPSDGQAKSEVDGGGKQLAA